MEWRRCKMKQGRTAPGEKYRTRSRATGWLSKTKATSPSGSLISGHESLTTSHIQLTPHRSLEGPPKGPGLKVSLMSKHTGLREQGLAALPGSRHPQPHRPRQGISWQSVKGRGRGGDLALLPSRHDSLGRTLLSEPQFPHLENGLIMGHLAGAVR